MKMINLVEILKECLNGMELHSTMFKNVKLKYVSTDNVDYPICIETQSGNTYHLTKYGQAICNDDDAKCVIFPKGKDTWKGFVPPCKFKDGDILVHTQNQRFIMSICHKKINESLLETHCILCDRDEGLSVNHVICWYNDSVRYATEEEKQKLFKELKCRGYKWNEETKTLDKLIKPKFNVGDTIQDSEGYIVRT